MVTQPKQEHRPVTSQGTHEIHPVRKLLQDCVDRKETITLSLTANYPCV